MNPDGDCWLISCLGLGNELSDIDYAGLHLEIEDTNNAN